ATVLATCVAVAHGDSERDQRHERQLAIAENDLLHATVGPLDRLTDVASTVRGKDDPTRDAIQQSAARTALQGAIRSGDTRSTGVLPAVGGSPRSLAVAVPVRAAGSGASGAFLATFSVPAVRAAVAAHLPPNTRIALAQGDAVDELPNALEKRMHLGDRDWTI